MPSIKEILEKLKLKKEEVYDPDDELDELDEWNFMCKKKGVCSKEDLYPYKEKRDIKQIHESHKNHPAIAIPEEAKEIVNFMKRNSKSDKEVAQKICKWVSKYIEYDNVHATASTKHKEDKNKIYMNAEETFETRTGICGEKSLLAIGMMNHANIPSTIYRPWYSHIAAISEITDKKRTKRRFMCDPTFNKFEEIKGEPITEKESKESHYEIGVSNVNANYKYNWNIRRESGKQFGLKNYNRELSTKELLDTERAHLCEPLKFGTLVGLKERKKMKPECKRLDEENRKKLEKEIKKLQKIKLKGTTVTNIKDYKNKDLVDWNRYFEEEL